MMTLATFTGASWIITSTPSTTSVIPGTAWFIFAGGTRPILMSEYNTSISNAHQLQLAGSTLAAGYTLANSIDLSTSLANTADVWGTNTSTNSGSGFVPIGSLSSTFKGTFNGQNYTISNLEISSSANEDIGL